MPSSDHQFRWRYVLVGGLSAVIAAALVWHFMKDGERDRTPAPTRSTQVDLAPISTPELSGPGRPVAAAPTDTDPAQGVREQEGEVLGTVVDEQGESVGEGEVIARVPSTGREYRFHLLSKGSFTGKISLPGVKTSIAIIFTNYPELTSEARLLTLSPLERATIRFVAVRTTIVSVLVIESGTRTPVAGVHVSNSRFSPGDPEAVTDDRGMCSLRVAPGGVISLVAVDSRGRHGMAESTRLIAGGRATCEIRMGEFRDVQLKVTAPRDPALLGQHIECEVLGGIPPHSIPVTIGGSLVQVAVPSGELVVVLRGEQIGKLTYSWKQEALPTSGGVLEIPVELGRTIRVRCRNESGTLLGGLEVRVRRGEGRVPSRYTDDQGLAVFSGLPEGSYEVSCEGSDSKTVDGGASLEALELIVRGYEVVAGRVRSSSGEILGKGLSIRLVVPGIPPMVARVSAESGNWSAGIKALRGTRVRMLVQGVSLGTQERSVTVGDDNVDVSIDVTEARIRASQGGKALASGYITLQDKDGNQATSEIEPSTGIAGFDRIVPGTYRGHLSRDAFGQDATEDVDILVGRQTPDIEVSFPSFKGK